MFQTDELVKIINQLQHADGMGYYDYCSSDRNRIFLAETGS